MDFLSQLSPLAALLLAHVQVSGRTHTESFLRQAATTNVSEIDPMQNKLKTHNSFVSYIQIRFSD